MHVRCYVKPLAQLICGLSCSLTISVVCSTLTVTSIFTLLKVCQETLLVSLYLGQKIWVVFVVYFITLNFFSHTVKRRDCWHNGQSIQLHTTECGSNTRMKRTKEKTTVYGPLASFLSPLKFYHLKLHGTAENVLLVLSTLHVHSHDSQHWDSNL